MTGHELLLLASGFTLGTYFMLLIHLGGRLRDTRRALRHLTPGALADPTRLHTALEDTREALTALAAAINTHRPPTLSTDDLRGGFAPNYGGGLCGVCCVNVNRGGIPDPDHPDCVAAHTRQEADQ